MDYLKRRFKKLKRTHKSELKRTRWDGNEHPSKQTRTD